MQRNAWKDIANWRIKATQQFFELATPCMDDHQFREEEKKMDQLENYLLVAHKLF